MNEEQLWLDQARKGDKDAFGQLIDAYQIPVYNLAYRMLNNSGEAEEAAQEAFALATEAVQAHADIKPDLVIREGTRSEEILKLIDEDQDIAILVLAAAPGKEGPGPLVTSIASGGGFPIPVTIVPAALSDEDIDALA